LPLPGQKLHRFVVAPFPHKICIFRWPLKTHLACFWFAILSTYRINTQFACVFNQPYSYHANTWNSSHCNYLLRL
jgi:hypothetical protein